MEAARERGYARSIGVSNFSVAELEQVIAVASTPPVVNQVQFSPFEYRRELLEACTSARRRPRGLQPAGHRPPPGRSRPSAEIADRLGRTPAQVLLRWCVQRETIVLPKSTHRERIEENAAVFDFALSDEDMAALDALDQTGGTDQARERKWW